MNDISRGIKTVYIRIAELMDVTLFSIGETPVAGGDILRVLVILTIAYLLSQMMNGDADMEVQLDNIPASRHLHLTTAEIMPTLQESNRQINSLRRALGK